MSGEFYNEVTPQGSNGPSCPYCGLTENVERIDHPQGTYYCTCGSLFWGNDDEWRRLALTRKHNVERRSGKRKPVEPEPRTVRHRRPA
jgi:hypothetical protein